MRTESFDYLRRELGQILRGFPTEQNMNNKPVLDLNRYAALDDKEIARQLRVAICAAEGRVIHQVEYTEQPAAINIPTINTATAVEEIEPPKPTSRLEWLIMQLNNRGLKW